MSAVTENESWIVDRGALVIEKKAQSGGDSLNEWERLVYCLWVTDYMMRNAGDFANAQVVYPDFQSDAKRFAKQLSLRATCEGILALPKEAPARIFRAVRGHLQRVEECRTWRFTEWRPSGTAGQFESNWRAAIGELIVLGGAR
jgi:hypothetical protein